MAEKNLKAFPKLERSQVLILASLKLKQFFLPSKKWVLRDLIIREFVKANTIALKPGLIKGPLIKGLGFSKVILLRICWSSNPNRSVPRKLPLYRGA
ncbi:hypothetical protein V2W45_1257012 [Cenococcum geophilum]